MRATANGAPFDQSCGGRLRRSKRLVLPRVKAFGAFWWEFLAGDAPGLVLGTGLVLGLMAGLVAAGVSVAAYFLPPLAVLAVLVISTLRARR